MKLYPQNLQQRYDDSSFGLSRSEAARCSRYSCSPPDSYSVCVCFWLSLPELKSTFQVGCSTKCAFVASVRGCLSLASDQTAGTRRALQIHQESTNGPSKLRKGTAPPFAAAIHLWLRYSALTRAARVPLQPSNCCSHLVIPPQSRKGDCLRNAEGAPPQTRGLFIYFNY